MKREIIQSLIYKILPKVNQVVYTLDTIYDSNIHTCDKGIRVVFFSFQVGFSKMYRLYRKINSFQGDFLIL